MIRREASTLVVFACLAAGTAAASRAEPGISGVSPTTIRPGATTDIVLRGAELTTVRAVASRPGVRVTLGTVEPAQAKVTIAAAADVAPGPVLLWTATDTGPATPQLLMLDDLPVVAATPKSHVRSDPQQVPAGACVEGTSDGGLSHFFRFPVAAGQRLAFEVLAAPIRSRIDPVMRLWDSSGRLLAQADDGVAGLECRFSHVFAQAGDAWLELRDSSYRADLPYRLRIGDFPLVGHAMPLVVRRGTTTQVGCESLDAASIPLVEVTIPADSTETAVLVPVRLPGGHASGWMQLLVRDDPQFAGDAASGPLTVPFGVSGRLTQPAARQSHRFTAAKDAKLRITARARSLGCGTVPRIAVLDATGKTVAESPITESDEPEFDVTLPADGEYRLEVEDLARRGGPGFGYFLEVSQSPGMAVEFKPVAATKEAFAVEPVHGAAAIDLVVKRSGHDGEITLSLAGGSQGLRIVNPVIPPKATEARIYLATDQGWSEQSMVAVRLQAATSGSNPVKRPVASVSLRRQREPQVPFPAAWADGVAVVAGVKPAAVPFAVEPAAPVVLTRGTAAHQIPLVVKRVDPGFKSGVTILADGLPAGLAVTSSMDKDTCTLVLSGSLAAGSEPTQLRLAATADHGRRTLLVPLVLPVSWKDATPAASPAAPTPPPAAPPAAATAAPSDTTSSAAPQPRLEVFPQAVVLDGSRDRQQLAISSVDAAGFPRDRTGTATITLADPAIATLMGTTLRPKADGGTEAVVEADGLRVVVPVTVRRAAERRPVQFENEVLVALSKQTCSSGACHGSPSGKGGFRLSLRAFDKQLDELTLLREEFGRRVNPLDPDASLLLRKPLMQLQHGGGRQLTLDDEAHAVLRTWIAEGAKADPPGTQRCVRLEVAPAGRQVQRLADGGRQIVATAHFADGSRRDVTHLAAYESSAVSVATVDAAGRVTPRRRGEAVILVRYLEHIELVPLMFIEERATGDWQPPPENNIVDTHVNRKLRDLGYPPSATCTDAEFIRRVHLDVIGILPTVDETRAFLADTSGDKRSRLIDRLLEREEYARFQALAWGDLLRMSKKHAGDDGVFKYHRWLEESFARNKPFDQFARELLLGSGSTNDNPPASFYRVVADMNETVETVAQLFLGVRLQCAKCHNHPFDRWSQDNYYGLGAFFERVKKRKTPVVGEAFVYVASTGETVQPRTGKPVKPWLPGAGDVDVPAGDDRRKAFADWLVSADNPFFARVEANRIWSRLFARGIVDPVDEFRDSNPPSNPPLLDALAKEFVTGGYDRKRLLRLILNSRTYQASCRPTKDNKDDTLYFSHQQPRLLSAEQLLDAIGQVTGVEQAFAGLPAGTKATQLPAPDVVKMEFLSTFGQPMRDTVCACERAEDSSLGMAIELFNGDTVHAMLVNPKNRFRTAVAAGRPVEQVIRELYLAAVCREPDDEELRATLARCAAAKDPASGVEDVCWALLNSDEFVFQH